MMLVAGVGRELLIKQLGLGSEDLLWRPWGGIQALGVCPQKSKRQRVDVQERYGSGATSCCWPGSPEGLTADRRQDGCNGRQPWEGTKHFRRT